MIKNIILQSLIAAIAISMLAGCDKTSEKAQYTVEYLVENKDLRVSFNPQCEGELASGKELSKTCVNVVEASSIARTRYHDVNNPNNTRMQTKPIGSEHKPVSGE